jgi:hypothetical protein
MNKLSLRIGLISLTVAGAAASQAYDFINLRAPNTGGQANIVQQGAFSAGVAASFNSFTTTGGGGSSTISDLSLTGGYFVTNEIQIFGDLRYFNLNNFAALGNVSETIFVVGGRYYFGVAQDKQTLPFAGIFVGGGQFNPGSTSVTAYGAELGLQYFLAPTVSLTPVLSYTGLHASGATVNQFGVSLGITVWFK